MDHVSFIVESYLIRKLFQRFVTNSLKRLYLLEFLKLALTLFTFHCELHFIVKLFLFFSSAGSHFLWYQIYRHVRLLNFWLWWLRVFLEAKLFNVCFLDLLHKTLWTLWVKVVICLTKRFKGVVVGNTP